MLLISRLTTRVRAALRMTKGSRNQPSCSTCGSMAASSAVAPAGGYTVFVMVIKAEARPHARAPASHRRFSKSDLREKSFVMPTPTRAAKKCPIIVFRGWARGDSMVLNSSIAAAP